MPWMPDPDDMMKSWYNVFNSDSYDSPEDEELDGLWWGFGFDQDNDTSKNTPQPVFQSTRKDKVKQVLTGGSSPQNGMWPTKSTPTSDAPSLLDELSKALKEEEQLAKSWDRSEVKCECGGDSVYGKNSDGMHHSTWCPKFKR